MSKFCVNCGAPLTEGAEFCINCGAAVPVSARPAAQPAQPQPAAAQPRFAEQPAQPVQQPAMQPMQPQYAAAPPAKAKNGAFVKALNVILAVVALALIVVGAITIPGKLRTEKLPPVAFTDVAPDEETAADYETLAAGGTLLGEEADEDWAASVTHETPEWYFADEDE